MQICKYDDTNLKMEKDNLIVNLSFQFALDIIVFTEQLELKRKYNLANQLFRSGTSIGANIREAQGCESKADFIHKMKIAYKEAEETRYWLELCAESGSYTNPGKLLDDILSILKVLGKIISSSKS
jgi:four helix bundle protein